MTGARERSSRKPGTGILWSPDAPRRRGLTEGLLPGTKGIVLKVCPECLAEFDCPVRWVAESGYWVWETVHAGLCPRCYYYHGTDVVGVWKKRMNE